MQSRFYAGTTGYLLPRHNETNLFISLPSLVTGLVTVITGHTSHRARRVGQARGPAPTVADCILNTDDFLSCHFFSRLSLSFPCLTRESILILMLLMDAGSPREIDVWISQGGMTTRLASLLLSQLLHPSLSPGQRPSLPQQGFNKFPSVENLQVIDLFSDTYIFHRKFHFP